MACDTVLFPARLLLSGCATVGACPTTDRVIHIKGDSRRVVLTGVEGSTFDEFFPPSSAPRMRTPSPPPAQRIPSPSFPLGRRFSCVGLAS
ncbi:hypothetical protein C8Q77DRAFT_651254 [Trametes polyzona]|nr:hypothetical protein C8Q77DRAFT_651254 [Trametes polyzona]